MKFQNFNNFNFMFQEFKRPFKVVIPANDPNKRDDLGLPIKDKSITKQVNEPLINNQNPNITYTNTEGGQQSMVSAVWESLAVKNAPRNTIIYADNHRYEIVSSTKVSGTHLWYYQLKETGDRE